MNFNVRVEFEERPIRHIAVECPKCHRIFKGSDATDRPLEFDYDIELAEFSCPLCGFEFGYKNGPFNPSDIPVVKELPYEEIYKGCLHRKTSWE